MIYIVISIRERSTRILTDHISKKKYFTDLALSKEEFNRMKGKCTDWYGINSNGEIAWINDVNGADYDIQILSIEK